MGFSERDQIGSSVQNQETTNAGYTGGRQEGFTPSVIVISIVILALLAYISAQTAYGLSRGLDHVGVPSMAALSFVLPIVWIGFVFRKFCKRSLFNSAQMTTLYSILSLGAVISGGSGIWILFNSIMAMTSLSTGLDPRAAGFASRFRTILAEISPMIIPRGDHVVKGFWDGSSSVPWGDWLVPIVMWTLYLAVIYCAFCLSHRIKGSFTSSAVSFPYFRFGV